MDECEPLIPASLHRPLCDGAFLNGADGLYDAAEAGAYARPLVS